MDQSEFLYAFGSVSIAIVLFAVIVVFNEVGFRVGRLVQARTNTEVATLTGAVQGSVLGLLALLLGFSFSMSMQRFDSRSMALIDEANAIGTAVLRVELLPQAHRLAVRELFSQYVDSRLAAGRLDFTRMAERRTYQARADELQSKLWDHAVAATGQDPRPVTTGAFINALNDVIDAQGKRNALLQAHVPEPILLLLFFVLLASIGIMGYSSGLSGKRLFVPLMLVSVIVTLIVFIIIDLDRPRRGFITVDQSSMLQLARSIER